MRFRIYEINDRDKIYYIVKQWKWFYWGLPYSLKLRTVYLYHWVYREFHDLETAINAVYDEIKYQYKPKWKKVVKDIDSDRDFPHI